MAMKVGRSHRATVVALAVLLGIGIAAYSISESVIWHPGPSSLGPPRDSTPNANHRRVNDRPASLVSDTHPESLGTAATNPTGPPISPSGAFKQPFRIGGLQVLPFASRHSSPAIILGLDHRTATTWARFAGVAWLNFKNGSLVVGSGLVTLTGAQLPSGLPPLQNTPAWIAFDPISSTRHPGAINCPAMHILPSAPPLLGPIEQVLVLYGSSAQHALLYSTKGSLPCGGTAAPKVQLPSALLPVPWRLSGPVGLSTPVHIKIPACAHLETVSADGNVRTGRYMVSVTVSVPFNRPLSCSARTLLSTTIMVYPPDLAGHPSPGNPSPPRTVILEHAPLPPATPSPFSVP